MKLLRELRHAIGKRLGKDDKSNLQNAALSSGAFLVGLASLLITTPLLFSTLGKEGMGVVVLVKTILGFGGVLSVGLGSATLKFVSKYRALGQEERIGTVIRTTLTTYLIMGSGAALLMFGLAGILVGPVFPVSEQNLEASTFAFRVASVGLLAGLLKEALGSAMKGFERFDVTVSLDVGVRILLLIGQVVLLLNGAGIGEIVILIVAMMFIDVLLRGIALQRIVFPGLSLRPSLDRECLRETLGFGILTWFAGLLAKCRDNGPVFLIGMFVGVEAVAIYNVAVKVLSQVGNFVSMGGQYLFPYISRLHETGDRAQVGRHYDQVTKIILWITAAMITPLFVCGLPVVRLWLDAELAREVMEIVRILALRFAVLPFAAMNYSFLVATGSGRALVTVNALSAAVILIATLIGVFLGGLEGAAWAQLSVFITLVGNRLYIEKKLIGAGSVSKQLGLVAGVGLPLLLGTRFWLGEEAGWLQVGGVAAIWALIGATLSCLAFEVMTRWTGSRKVA